MHSAQSKIYHLAKVFLPHKISWKERQNLLEYISAIACSCSSLGLLNWEIATKKKEKILAIESEFIDLSNRVNILQPIEIWFDSYKNAKLFYAQIKLLFPLVKVGKVSKIKNSNWVQSWKKYYKRILIEQNGGRLWIFPAWMKISQHALRDISLRIYPGQAFGAGTHATTELCLRAFLKTSHLFKEHKKISVLDFGAGTGILGIAVQKWGQKNHIPVALTAIEIDPEARKIFRKNAALNACPAKLYKSLKSSRQQYQIVFANVLYPVLMQFRALLLQRLGKYGVLIVSGVLKEQAKPFLREFITQKQKKLFKIAALEKNGWSALIISRR